jgi:hypothetical protein
VTGAARHGGVTYARPVRFGGACGDRRRHCRAVATPPDHPAQVVERLSGTLPDLLARVDGAVRWEVLQGSKTRLWR